MIKMCDLPRYADADMEEIKKMKEAHTVLNQVTYEPKPLYHGYTDKRLRINVTDNTIDMIDIPQEVKEKCSSRCKRAYLLSKWVVLFCNTAEWFLLQRFRILLFLRRYWETVWP